MNETGSDNTAFSRGAANLARGMTPRSWTAFIALTVAAVAGNYFAIPLFFGVEFIFGSIFVLFAVHGFGVWRGALVALAAGLYTWISWHHPYFALMLISEAIFVGVLLRRTRNILLLDGIFWILIGMPMMYLAMQYALQMDTLEASVIALKSAVNGLFNALTASLLIKHLPPLAWPGRPRTARLLSLRQAAFNIIVGCVLIPTLIITVIDCNRAKNQVEDDLLSDATQRARLLSTGISNWKEQRIATLARIATLTNDASILPQGARASTRDDQLTQGIALLARTLPDTQAIVIRDENGREIATFSTGQSADNVLRTFKARTDVRAPVSTEDSSIHIVRPAPTAGGAPGETAPLYFIFREPIRNAKFRGYVIAVVSHDTLQNILEFEFSGSSSVVSLLDQSGHIIASTRDDVRPFSRFTFSTPPDETGRIIEVDANTYRLFPTTKVPPLMRWKNSSLIRRVNAVHTPWKIVVEAPFARHQRRLQTLYFNNLTLMMGLSLAGLALAALISRALTRPLQELASVTHKLPERLMSDEAVESIHWPDSRLDQMQALIGNFKEMSSTLRTNFRDVASTRARLEEEQASLKEAIRLKDEFLAIVSHELRTPLVPVIGYADLLSRGVLTSEEDRVEAVHAIERNARIQLRLVEDLLDVSRIVAGQMRIESGAVDLSEIIRDSIGNIHMAAQAKEIEITSELEPDFPLMLGDRSRLTQVMWNLLSNAIKFTPQNGHLHVSLTREKNQAVISVRDNGQGISAEFLPHIFARFRQESTHLTRVESGLGLGLSIVHDIVALHGGTIEAFSDGEGLGATFVVKLPLQSTMLLNARRNTAAHEDTAATTVS